MFSTLPAITQYLEYSTCWVELDVTKAAKVKWHTARTGSYIMLTYSEFLSRHGTVSYLDHNG
jgi:hypothetical protein